MNAQTQYKLTASDLDVVLSLVRAGTLADAGARLGVDASTVFRAVQRMERGLGQPLFERSRSGYAPLELAQSLVESAEQLEATLESARAIAQTQPEQVSGTVRLTTTDAILHGLIGPTLATLHAAHPLLAFELHTGNELVSLTRRDADIAVRATKRPPQHLIGKYLGPIRVAVFAARSGVIQHYADVVSGCCGWIAPDDALPEHPSVVWRKKHLPKVVPLYRVHSVLAVLELVSLGLGVGVLPLFLTEGRQDLLQLTDVIGECETDLWLLAHPESRHSRRVATVYAHLAEQIRLA
ncbi:LysR family transcriptional regulator [Aquabacterium sp.]|uniref:LysR family transcriptional regulator n=1 Tax=Aquabacterium sp. TaxID=1872578 RepID=UPI004037BADF